MNNINPEELCKVLKLSTGRFVKIGKLSYEYLYIEISRCLVLVWNKPTELKCTQVIGCLHSIMYNIDPDRLAKFLSEKENI